MSIELQFADVLQLWEAALQARGGTISFASANEATKVMHRLHMARKRLRERDGACAYDTFITEKRGATLTLRPRPMIDLDAFSPLTADLELDKE